MKREHMKALVDKLMHAYHKPIRTIQTPVYGIKHDGKCFVLQSTVRTYYQDGSYREFVNSCGEFDTLEKAEEAQCKLEAL